MTDTGFALEEWQIRLLLPHRPPILQPDRIDHCAPALDALDASKALGGADAMVARPRGAAATLAPAGLTEALAQCCGLLARLRWLAASGADLAAFAAGDASQIAGRVLPRSALAESQVIFSRPARPGRMLRLSARLLLARGDMHRFETSAHAGADGDLARATLVLKFPYAA